MKKTTRSVVAKETVEIVKQGFYINSKKEKIFLSNDCRWSQENSQLFTNFKTLFEERSILPKKELSTKIELTPETTLEACNRLILENESKIFVLNFASAKNPGGGFLAGAHAQEESLARSSALYASLTLFKEGFYDHHRALTTCLYSDRMIYSPNVPVFRDDEGHLLDQYYKVSFLTSPAVNAGVVLRQEQENIPQIKAVMLARLEKLLSIALVKGYPTLVLGAWGCGVFQNNPVEVADYFYTHLMQNPIFTNQFQRIVFAVYSPHNKTDNYVAFSQKFGIPVV